MRATTLLVGIVLAAGVMELRACGEDAPRAAEAAAGQDMFYLMYFKDQATCAGFLARIKVGGQNNNCSLVDNCKAAQQIDLYRNPGLAKCHIQLKPGDGEPFSLGFSGYRDITSTLWITLTNGHAQSSYGKLWATTIPDASRVSEIFLAAE